MKLFLRGGAFLAIIFCWLNVAETTAQQPPPQIARGQTIEEAKTAESADDQTETSLMPDLSEFNSTRKNLSRAGVNQTQTLTLTLDEAVRRALENNNNIEVARDDVRYQEQQLRSLEGFYDLTLNVAPTFSRSATNGQEGSNDFTLNAGIFRPIRQGGGTINTFFNTNQTGRASANNTTFTQTSGLSSGSNTTYFSNLGVTYNQPLFKNFKIDNNRRQIKIQRKRLQQTDADFRRQTIEIIAQVQRAYWELVFALRDQQNRTANVDLAKENLSQTEAKIQAGTAAPLDRAEVATELANRESDLLLSTQQVSVAENTLKTLLLKDPTAPEWTEAIVPTDQPTFTLEPTDLDAALRDAAENRPELSRLRLQKDINAIDIKYFKNQTRPQIDFNSTVSLGGLSFGNLNNGSGTTSFPLLSTAGELFLLQGINDTRASLPNPLDPIEIPTVTANTTTPNFFSGGTFQSIQNLFRSDAINYSFGVTFSFPIGNKTAKANLAGARILEEQTDANMRLQEQQVVAEVRNAVQSVETARQRVLSARRGVENAEIQLNGERKLFDAGRSTQFLLFQRENSLTNARNTLIRAETDYNKAIADLQQATSTTFLMNNIQVEPPIDDK